MVGYKLSKNDWVTPFFVIFRSVREKLLVTVFFDHPVLWSSKCHVYFMTNYDLVQLAGLLNIKGSSCYSTAVCHIMLSANSIGYFLSKFTIYWSSPMIGCTEQEECLPEHPFCVRLCPYGGADWFHTSGSIGSWFLVNIPTLLTKVTNSPSY